MGDAEELAIIGGGPAGYTAGIYAARAGLGAAILEQGYGGGQASTSPWMENYPGFEGISGMDLMERMKAHAQRYLRVVEGASVEAVVREGGGFVLRAGEREWHASAVIFATGAGYKKLGIPGEAELLGMGVSYCATCDGMFFRGRKVAVIGGGNSGATEALHLRHVGADVTLIHRRDALRAEKVLQERLKAEGVKLLLERETLEVVGESAVKGLRLRDKSTGAEEFHEFGGVFISVGVEPNVSLATGIGIELDDEGFIKTDRSMRTNVRMAYAAGDVTGGLRQVITACAGGAVAALSAYDDLKNPYWK
jgi:thioredoxin reductase (NADPH)